jgi:TonB family protein
MLAAIFGRDEIVSLLLAAGADVRLKDSLGLTASEWSVRRGFSNIAQLIANASTPKLPKNVTAGPIHPEAHSGAHVQAHHATEAIRGQAAAETEIASQRDGGRMENNENPKAGLGAAGLAMLRSRAAEQVAEFDTEAETVRRQTTLGQSHAPATNEGARTEHLEPAIAEEESTATQSETIKLRIELDRIFEESRRRVEEEIAKPSARQTQTFNQTVTANQQPAPLTIPAAALAPTGPAAALANESDEPSNVKRCPKCHTVYKNTLLVYCPRDTTRLWRVEGPSLNQLPAHASGHPILWVMIAITLSGAAFATYRLTNYFFETVPPTPAVATKTEQPKVAATKPLPVVGGALVGTELNVPDPEYPTAAAGKSHSDGISGTVTVQVQVNGKGKVISTHVLNGEWSLRMAATKAAKNATFAPEKLGGKGRIVTGTITYDFVAPQTEPPATTGSPTASPDVTKSRMTTGSSAANPEGDLPVTGDALAGAEINLPKAEYPESAKSRKVSGTITVTVRVNREGRVISWLTSSGDSRLRAAALKAAKKATFAPEKLPGKGEVVGTITYNFKL